MTDFNLQLEEWIRDGRALKYFGDRDKSSIPALKQMFAELPAPEKKTELSDFNKNLVTALNTPNK